MMGFGTRPARRVPLAVLGLAPVLDAPPGRARTDDPAARSPAAHPAAPAHSPPRLVRRLADPRVGAATSGAARLPSGVAISRVPARYTPGEHGYPNTLRIPATDPQVGCRGTASCLGRQIFRPGRSLTVRGAFRLRVLRGRGPVRVETTWLDRTPPTVAVARTTVVRRFGTGNELVLDLLADARGAGVARVEIDHGGAVTRIDADDVPGLVAGRRGHGRVRVPLVAGAAARVWLVDAAGNVSPPVQVDVAAAASVRAATIGSSPARRIGAGERRPARGRPERDDQRDDRPRVRGAGRHVPGPHDGGGRDRCPACRSAPTDGSRSPGRRPRQAATTCWSGCRSSAARTAQPQDPDLEGHVRG